MASRFLAVGGLGIVLVGCGLAESAGRFFEAAASSELPSVTTDTMEQLGDTLHSLEHLFLLLPAYLVGEMRRPLWGKWKNRKNNGKGKG